MAIHPMFEIEAKHLRSSQYFFFSRKMQESTKASYFSLIELFAG